MEDSGEDAVEAAKTILVTVRCFGTERVVLTVSRFVLLKPICIISRLQLARPRRRSQFLVLYLHRLDPGLTVQ